MAAWHDDGLTWPEVAARVHELSGERVSWSAVASAADKARRNGKATATVNPPAAPGQSPTVTVPELRTDEETVVELDVEQIERAHAEDGTAPETAARYEVEARQEAAEDALDEALGDGDEAMEAQIDRSPLTADDIAWGMETALANVPLETLQAYMRHTGLELETLLREALSARGVSGAAVQWALGYEAAIDDTLSEQRVALDEIAETRQAQPRRGWFSWR